MLKKFLKQLTISAFFLFILSSLFIQSTAALSFLDVEPAHWFYHDVENGVTKGYIDDKPYFRPGDNLNRAEFAKMIFEAWNLKIPLTSKQTFKDVPRNVWFGSAVETLAYNKIVDGYKDNKGNATGYFGPGDPVTREQAAKMLMLVSKVATTTSGGPHFPDVTSSSWSYLFIESLYHKNVVDGYKDGTYRPRNFINRAESAKLIAKLLEVAPAANTPSVSTNPTNPTNPPPSTPNPAPTTPTNPSPTPSQNTLTSDGALTEIMNAFKSIRSQITLPVQGKTIEDVESSFGPRIRNSTDKYDWHRGIDFDAKRETPVLAVFDGEFIKIDQGEEGGTTIYLKHKFPSPIYYNGKKLEYFYTLYMHLDTVISSLETADRKGEHPQVKKGQQIATVGHTGTEVDHLHMDLRVGTYCSLEFQLKNTNSSCAKGFMFDPHMHPMYLFEPLTPDMKVEVVGTASKAKDTIVRFSSPQNQPLLNRIEYQLLNSSTGKVIASHVLDFNQRLGYDASTNPKLDVQDKTKPYISPLKFTDASTIYSTDIVIPSTFVANAAGDKSVVKVTDIWGNTQSLEWKI